MTFCDIEPYLLGRYIVKDTDGKILDFECDSDILDTTEIYSVEPVVIDNKPVLIIVLDTE